MTVEIKEGTSWKNERFFSTYEEANTMRKSLTGADKTGTLAFKVKRCGVGGTMYVVKSRVDPAKLAELHEIEEKLLSKKSKKKGE
jgi:hypothetical protein